MYNILLTTHSLFRWLVLVSLLYAIYRNYKGWFYKRPFTKFDNSVRHVTATMAHIQLTLGFGLYLISPVINYFLNNYNSAVKIRDIRFFGMEHSLMMIVAVVIITIGSAKAQRKSTEQEKFKTIAIWFSIGLFIILTSIPWGFFVLPSRPFFRSF